MEKLITMFDRKYPREKQAEGIAVWSRWETGAAMQTAEDQYRGDSQKK